MNPALSDRAARLIALLKEYSLTVTAAESCTGGLVAAALTSVPGASAVLGGTAVVYSPEIKSRLLGIPDCVVYEIGVVSPECAAAMAEGAARLFAADLALAVTGFAGPTADPGHPDPVGTVYMAVTLAPAGAPPRTLVHRTVFPGDRTAVRESAAAAVIDLALEILGDGASGTKGSALGTRPLS